MYTTRSPIKYYQLIICQRERRRRTRLILYSDHSVLMTRAFTDIRVWRLKVTPPYLGHLLNIRMAPPKEEH